MCQSAIHHSLDLIHLARREKIHLLANNGIFWEHFCLRYLSTLFGVNSE